MRTSGMPGTAMARTCSCTSVAACFAGLRPLQRHRLVYDAAGDLLPGRIHALQLRALTPEEFDQE